MSNFNYINNALLALDTKINALLETYTPRNLIVSENSIVQGNSTVDGNFTVQRDTILQGSLSVDGRSAFVCDSSFAHNVTIGTNCTDVLTVHGRTAFDNDINVCSLAKIKKLDVAHNATLGSNSNDNLIQ